MRQRNLLFVYASSEKNLREKKEPSLLERTSFLLRFGEHRDNSRNSQSVFLVVYATSEKNYNRKEEIKHISSSLI